MPCGSPMGPGSDANLMIFYSFDNLGTFADVRSVPNGFAPNVRVTEDANGSFLYVPAFDEPGGGGENLYHGRSSVPGPIAGAGLPGLILAAGGLHAWRRRRKLLEPRRSAHAAAAIA
jgi:hypothetical protein